MTAEEAIRYLLFKVERQNDPFVKESLLAALPKIGVALGLSAMDGEEALNFWLKLVAQVS